MSYVDHGTERVNVNQWSIKPENNLENSSQNLTTENTKQSSVNKN
jgi:hypothetical protein